MLKKKTKYHCQYRTVVNKRNGTLKLGTTTILITHAGIGKF